MGGSSVAPGTYKGLDTNSLLAQAMFLSKMKQQKDEDELKRQEKQILREKQKTELDALARKERETTFGKEVEGTFGTKATDPDVAPYTRGARALLEPGARVKDTVSDQPMFTSEGTKTWNVMSQAPRPRNFRDQLDRGREEMRRESLRTTEGLPEGPERDALGREVKESKVPPAPAKIMGVAKERLDVRGKGVEVVDKERDLGEKFATADDRVRQAKAKTRTDEAGATTAETTAKFAEERAQAGARKDVAEAKKSEYEALYMPYLKKLELETKDLEVKIKKGDLQKQPVDYANAVQELANKKMQATKLGLDLKRAASIERLKKEYDSSLDATQQVAILREIAVLNGHEIGVITDIRQQGRDYVDATQAAQKMLITAQEYASKGEIPAAQSAYDNHNQIMLNAAQMFGSKTTTLQTAMPEEGVFRGATLKSGSWTGPTEVAVAWKQGVLDAAITGGVPGIDAGWALAQKIAIEHAYGKGNPKVFENAIKTSGASPEVQAQAMALLGQATKTQAPADKPRATLTPQKDVTPQEVREGRKGVKPNPGVTLPSREDREQSNYPWGRGKAKLVPQQQETTH